MYNQQKKSFVTTPMLYLTGGSAAGFAALGGCGLLNIIQDANRLTRSLGYRLGQPLSYGRYCTEHSTDTVVY